MRTATSPAAWAVTSSGSSSIFELGMQNPNSSPTRSEARSRRSASPGPGGGLGRGGHGDGEASGRRVGTGAAVGQQGQVVGQHPGGLDAVPDPDPQEPDLAGGEVVDPVAPRGQPVG